MPADGVARAADPAPRLSQGRSHRDDVPAASPVRPRSIQRDVRNASATDDGSNVRALQQLWSLGESRAYQHRVADLLSWDSDGTLVAVYVTAA